MATVNRYTQTQENRYTPRTLQELMVAPAYKRGKHDELESSIAQYETALAQTDALGVHGGRLQEEQQKLYDRMLAQRDKLESEGFSQNAKSDFIRFNKDYQQAIGPQGTIGKIGQAKQAFNAEKEAYIQNATKQGFPADAAAANWEEHVKQYTGDFETSKDIKNISPLYAPNYKDPVTELRGLLKEAGMDASDISNIGSDIIFDPAKGSYVLTTKDRDAESSNTKALQSALDYMNRQVLNPNSDIGKSIKHARKNPQDVIDELTGLNKVYQKTSTVKEDASQISNFTPLKDTDNEITANGAGLTIASTQYSPAKFAGNTYGDVAESIKDMKSREGELTEEEQITLMEMEDFKTSIENELAGDNHYNELKSVLDKAEADVRAMRNGSYDYTKNPLYSPAASQESRNLINSGLVSNLNSIMGEMDKYTEPFVKNAKLQVTEYAVTPLTSKQRTAYDIINENADRLLRVSPQSLEQLGDINDIITPEGEVKAITNEEDRKGIANMIFNSKPGSVTVVSHVPRGASGKPEVVFRIETDKDNTYDLEGLIADSSQKNLAGYVGDIGGGKPLQVRLAFNESTKNIGGAELNNVLGLLQDYIASTGPIGQEFVGSQKINQFKSKYAGQTWGDIQSAGINSKEVNLAYAQALRDSGISSASSDEEIAAAQEKLKNVKIKR